ncbi:hypothetical protein E2C01_028556 [Portunus trituberculatus]|uniref:Uncharacterized protein n=1 Tax=Portunus trituberculatus TaxID=210409 RepID=A0A5B7EPR8_PORTR|nr:hypothetical protein [Portunus trituberculatus]
MSWGDQVLPPFPPQCPPPPFDPRPSLPHHYSHSPAPSPLHAHTVHDPLTARHILPHLTSSSSFLLTPHYQPT